MVYWTRRGLVGLEATASEFATQCQNPTLLFFSSILFVSGFLDTEVSVAPTHVSRLVGWLVGWSVGGGQQQQQQGGREGCQM